MSHLYYWSPGSTSGQTTLGADDHYLRLGEFVESQEPEEANVGEGIFFYTSGKYSLKSTGAVHQEVDGPVTRTIETGNFTYTNDGGNLSITAREGGVLMTAKEEIKIVSKQETSDDSTESITIDAGSSHDVYFQHGTYYKLIDKKKEKTTKALNHKTNIGLLINTHIGVSITTALTLDMTYSSFSLSTTALEISVKAIALSWEVSKSSLALITFSLSFWESKKIFLDEEFCGIKNEVKKVRFGNGFGDWYVDWCFYKDNYECRDMDATAAEFKRCNITF